MVKTLLIGRLYSLEQGFVEGGLLVAGERIEAVLSTEEAEQLCQESQSLQRLQLGEQPVPAESEEDEALAVYDLRGGAQLILPGLIDTHFHGCRGEDICDAKRESLETISAYEASRGVTTLVPATMTLPESLLDQISKTYASYVADPQKPKGAEFVGIHMEGPFINIRKKGAQNGEHIHRPDVEMMDRLQCSCQHAYKIVTLAPEVEGAMEFIDKLHEELSISVGHTEASYAIAKEAFERGANRLTHCFNAMPGVHHRNPGPICAAAERPDTWIELITDGIHIEPSVVRLAFAAFGSHRLVLVSDSMRATGLSDGDYTLGGQAVRVSGKSACLADGTLAGSVTDLLGCVKTAVTEMEIPLEVALRCASYNPACSVGIEEHYGGLAPQKFANFFVADENLEPQAVWVKGERI